MRVLIAGDVHGFLQEFAERVSRCRRDHGVDAVIQLGDFGFDAATLDAFHDSRIRFSVPVYAIDGNHEDHHWLEQEVRRGAIQQWQREYNLHFQPRVSIARLGSSSVGFLGGALHVDRPQILNRTSRTCNYITRRQRQAAVELFSQSAPDLLATHTCPSGIGIGIRSNPDFASSVMLHVAGAGFDAGPQEDCGDTELTSLWQHVKPRPKAWVFGHFHILHAVTIEQTQFVCPGAATRVEKPHPLLLVWDTEQKRLEMVGE